MDPPSSSNSSEDGTTQQSSPNNRVGTKEKSKRPQLSCNKCRVRKVKCDRVQPCSACSLHQIANECEYDLSQDERQPILQAEALRRSRKELEQKEKENEYLRGELAAMAAGQFASGSCATHYANQKANYSNHPMRIAFPCSNEDLLHGASSASNRSDSMTQQPLGHFSEVQAHLPHMQAIGSYPFPTFWTANQEVSALIAVLPTRQEIYGYADTFMLRSVGFNFPYCPHICKKRVLDRLLVEVSYLNEDQADDVAVLFAMLMQAVLYGVQDRHGSSLTPTNIRQEIEKSDRFMAASVQALRLSSFTSKPTFRTVEAMCMIVQYLADTGRFADAWSLLSLTVRLGFWIDLHRRASHETISDPEEDPTTRTKLWRWLMHLDLIFSMVCGRPLAASKIGDHIPPEGKDREQSLNSLESLRCQTIITGRAILGQARIGSSAISRHSEELLRLSQTLSLSTCSNPDDDVFKRSLPSWPQNMQHILLHNLIHTLNILVNQRRQFDHATSRMPGDETTISYERVLESSRSILQAFEFVRKNLKQALRSWFLCQTSFNAAIILTRAMAETSQIQDFSLIKQAYDGFQEIHSLGIHGFAGSAATQIDSLCSMLQAGIPIAGEVMTKDGMTLMGAGSSPQIQMGTSSTRPLPTSSLQSKVGQTDSLSGSTASTVVPVNQDRLKRKSRLASVQNNDLEGKIPNKRNQRREKEQVKTGPTGPKWAIREPHIRGQSNRQWSVGKRQQVQASTRQGHTQVKQRVKSATETTRHTAAVTEPDVSQPSQYTQPDVMSSFLDSSSLSAQDQQDQAAWDELTSQLLLDPTGSTHSLEVQNKRGHATMEGQSNTGMNDIISKIQGNASSNITSNQVLSSLGQLGGHRDSSSSNSKQQRFMQKSGLSCLSLPSQSQPQPQQQKQEYQQQHQQHHHHQQAQQDLGSSGVIAAQHVFASNNNNSANNDMFAQPQSPALWGFQFNPAALDQGFPGSNSNTNAVASGGPGGDGSPVGTTGATGTRTQVRSHQHQHQHQHQQGQHQGQQQQGQQQLRQDPLFPGGTTDPNCFWDMDDESNTQFLWGG